MPLKKNVFKFNQDIKNNSGYLYSNTNKLSCILANDRYSKAIINTADFKGKKVIDIGCGDATYSMELFKMDPSYLLGVDAAESAIAVANSKVEGYSNIKFLVIDIYELEKVDEHFDIAVVRGVLHHVDDAEKAIKCISKIADEVIVLEPNGYNPVLKIIEKISKYHIEHEEKSYLPCKLKEWFINEGGIVSNYLYCGLVPMFCPDFFALLLKYFEPVIEKLPLINALLCGVYVQKIKTSK